MMMFGLRSGKDRAGCSPTRPAATNRRNGREQRLQPIARTTPTRVVAEVNNCGEMVEAALRVIDPNVAFAAVRASRDKVTRAEPVAALYEQGGFIISAPSRSSKIRCPALCPLVTAMSPCARRDTRPTASTPWCGR
jgi:phage terminase large subunit-like protein